MRSFSLARVALLSALSWTALLAVAQESVAQEQQVPLQPSSAVAPDVNKPWPVQTDPSLVDALANPATDAPLTPNPVPLGSSQDLFPSSGTTPTSATPPARPPQDTNTGPSAVDFAQDPKQAVRQQGISVGQPLAIGLGRSLLLSDQLHLNAWRDQLHRIGVSDTKITFEANRLSRADFDMWASRLIWSQSTP